mmetsp:Transcript_3935/g.12082  ORF Transcript_3935/g.12082 Transcript_3935/m.12082 type:complete len:252 (-) Transcript_3935:251-1006(-)
MEWKAAESVEPLSAPLLDGDEEPQRRRREVATGGGDVSYMLRELSTLVRQLKRSPTDKALLDSAWVVAESIQAGLRPPNPATLSGAQRRELRSCLAALQKLGDAEAAATKFGGGGFDAAAEEAKETLEIEQPRRQLVLQEEEEKDYDEELAQMRQRDLDSLNTRLTTVNQIFTDIASLITTQQEEVDSIEAAVSNAHTRTNKGQQQLVRAERRRTAKMKCCFYFAIGLAIFAVFLILAIIGFKNLAGSAAL